MKNSVTHNATSTSWISSESIADRRLEHQAETSTRTKLPPVGDVIESAWVSAITRP